MLSPEYKASVRTPIRAAVALLLIFPHLIRDDSVHDQTNIEDNRILLSGMESYYAPNEETLINVNFRAFIPGSNPAYIYPSNSLDERHELTDGKLNGSRTGID